MFPFWQIADSASVATAVSFAVLFLWHRRSPMNFAWDVVVPALLVGLTVLTWRSVGNVAQLNNDPVPGYSPNDLLCPVITYTFLGCYGSFRSPANPACWERIRVGLTLVSLLVNVVTI